MRAGAVLAVLIALSACAKPPPPIVAPPPPVAAAAPANDRRPPDITARLSDAQRAAIADAAEACWVPDAAAARLTGQSVQLVAVFDEAGRVRSAYVEDADRDRLSDTRFRAFAERAMAAARSPRCAQIPLPAEHLGRPGRVAFRFKP